MGETALCPGEVVAAHTPNPQRRSTSRILSRRALFGGAAAVAAAWRASADDDPARTVRTRADADPASLVERLVDRITFGTTTEEIALARSLGYNAYLEHHLDHLAIDDSTLDAMLAPLTTLSMPYSSLAPLAESQTRNELIGAAILRATFSKRQLFERMVELWTDHFNIDILTADHYKTVDDRSVPRAHALGTFPALLDASAHSPAMLYYLNNNVSTAGNPNENYARELMELHTLGVSGGYTQTDVQEVARCLTGWTIWGAGAGAALHGTFRYNNGTHDNGQKTVLGNVIAPGGGVNDGLTVLSLLVNHPSTAQFIAGKICRHFLGYGVSQGIINKVAQTYTSTNGDIKEMLRVALRPQHLQAAAPKIKRPFHHFISALRASGATISSTNTLRARLFEAGHQPYTWPTPDGYPDQLSHWSSNILVRWNFGATAVSGTITGVVIDDAAFYSGATTADQMIARINERLFANRMPADERDRIRAALLPEPVSVTRRRDALGLAIGSPAFQWY
jgi:uncharacterized protein (DUF1800 family)